MWRIFREVKNTLLTHHVYHAFHHVLTIKTPRRKRIFSKTPLKNTSKNNKTPERFNALRGLIFSEVFKV